MPFMNAKSAPAMYSGKWSNYQFIVEYKGPKEFYAFEIRNRSGEVVAQLTDCQLEELHTLLGFVIEAIRASGPEYDDERYSSNGQPAIEASEVQKMEAVDASDESAS